MAVHDFLWLSFLCSSGSVLALILDSLPVTTWILSAYGNLASASLVSTPAWYPPSQFVAFAWFKPAQTKPKTLSTPIITTGPFMPLRACQPSTNHLPPSQATYVPLCAPDTQCSARVLFQAAPVLSAQNASLILCSCLWLPGDIYTLWFSIFNILFLLQCWDCIVIICFCACLLLNGKLCNRYFVYRAPFTVSVTE